MNRNIPVRKINVNKVYAFHERFSIQDIRRKLDGKAMVEPLHRHDFFFILVLKKGKGTHKIDFVEYKIADYSVYFIKPGQVHQITLDAISVGYLLLFSDDAYHENRKSLTRLLREVSAPDLYQFEKKEFKRIYQPLKTIFRECANKEKGYEEVIRANLSIVFNLLSRSLDQIEYPKEVKYEQERIEELMLLLDEHISNKKQVSQYAELMKLSKFQLNTIVKTTLGRTCSQVIKDRVILEAKRYLLATSFQINQIAFYLGYDDISYFARLFKKQTGHSPKAYRQKFK